MHYDAMVKSDVGSKVADLYINWAFYFDVNDQFPKADQIFKHGLNAHAEPLDLLQSAHQAFGYSMSQRMLYKSDENFQRKLRIQMKKQLEEIASLRIDGTNVNATKSMALQIFDKTKLMSVCIPNCDDTKKIVSPENRLNTSVAQNIIDSARKMRRERSHRVSTKGCRLDFNENACTTTTITRSEVNLYEKGIQLGRNFKKKNLPQRQVPPTPYCDPAIGTFRGDLPGYDKIMLVPATNMAFSIEELKAYKWYKQQRIENTFTKRQDKIWGIGYDVSIRYADVFARKNFPQSEWIVDRIMSSDELNERGPHKFMCNMTELYPKNAIEEYSLDEVMWQKRKASVIEPQLNKSVMKSFRNLNQTNINDSKLSPIVEMELSGVDDALVELPRRRESIHRNIAIAEPNKKRKSSVYPVFDALNDTCTTQMFSNLLHSTAISTPKVKMPKIDDSVGNQWQEETKLKLFNDQSSDLLPDLNKIGIKNGQNQPNDVGFAIYEDKTLTIHAAKSAACKETIDNLSIGNKENIVVNENQLVNLEPMKTSGKFESAVINLATQSSTKEVKDNADVLQPNGFKFDIYTDNTETMLNVWENVQKLTDSKTSIENKENQIIEQPKHNTSIEEEIATVNKMIESVLNATKPVELDATKQKIINLNATNRLNATENIKDQSVFKAPLPPKKTEPDRKPSDTFYDLLDTTEEFEMLEAQCANSPNLGDISLDLPSIKLEQSIAKSVILGASNLSKLANKTVRLSIQLTDEERANIVNNPAVCDKTRLNWTQQPNQSPIVEHDEAQQIVDKEHEIESEEDNDIGKSIYIPQPEPEFNEKDADWKEVTQFLADTTATNEYKVEEVNLDETKQRIDTHMLNMKDLNPFDPEVQKDILVDIGFIDQLAGANNFNCVMVNIVQPLKPKIKIEINNQKYQVRKLIGTGAFGKVFSAECVKTKETFALKQQRPPNLWEYYVCLEIHNRLKNKSIVSLFLWNN